MSKSFEKLTKDLASGMSRRKSLQRFLGGLGAGAAALLTGRRAFAGGPDMEICLEWCQALTAISRPGDFGACMSESARCPEGFCARPIQFNSTGPGGFPGEDIQWICVAVRPIVVPGD